ncbi:MAG: preprotein translocase subunit SecE [Planctomycetota bacterium]|jgi:preprotein translocase subunit SecE
MDTYKAGQGSLARLTAWVAILITLVLGCAELYSWIQDPITDQALLPWALFQDLPFFGTKFSWKFLLCALIFVAGLWLCRRILTKKSTVDALIETEQELRKVSWPTRDESISATGVVILVSVLLTAALFSFDLLFNRLFSLIF